MNHFDPKERIREIERLAYSKLETALDGIPDKVGTIVLDVFEAAVSRANERVKADQSESGAMAHAMAVAQASDKCVELLQKWRTKTL